MSDRPSVDFEDAIVVHVLGNCNGMGLGINDIEERMSDYRLSRLTW